MSVHLMTSTTVMPMPPVTTLQDHSCASATLVTPVMVSFVRMMTSVLIQSAMNMPLALILMVHSNAHVTLVSPVTDSLVLILMSVHLMTSTTVTLMLSVPTLKLHLAALVLMVSLVMVFHASMTVTLNPLAKKTSLAHTLKTELLSAIVSTASS